jgi:hypothetical protein
MKDMRLSAEVRREAREEAFSMGRPKEASRPDWECAGCGAAANGEHAPPKCGKCGSWKWDRVRPIFQDIAAIIRRVRDDAREGAVSVVTRKHRKADYIARQFRVAEEAMNTAQRAIFVEGGR